MNATHTSLRTPLALDTVHAQYVTDLAAYEEQVGRAQREAYAEAAWERLKVVSTVRPRPADDLRNEERLQVYRPSAGQRAPVQPAAPGVPTRLPRVHGR
ncbi:hypothetical protein GCM10009730_54870 [Streptomyces albidochromogenes]|uniref:hypothetical protein n=1 Tax=Streptomyces albidochromogenes TaxID=329524 RepID=UPI00110F8F2D|nr:hypothetical protein [Streptomyces albidochromogenes]